MNNKRNKVAIYCRLSEEDRNKKNRYDDSGSIQNQKLMLTEYAAEQNWDIYDIYSDDDYTGSDRERPAFNRMITDARSKKFDIVLCKTQSRFTRELEIVEKYIHTLFPELGIRFVSVVDNIDTAVAGNKKSRQINGLINEWYLEDMSDSIKAALRTRMKAGYFIGSFAPFGYIKDPDKSGHLIIDEEAAEIVRLIFELYNQGVGRTSIARILNEKGIPSPEEYNRIKGLKKHGIGKQNSRYWKYYTVSHILENEVYIGNLIQGKTYNPTYKSKHSSPADKSQWVRVENTHEAIIDPETWQKTRRIWNSRSKPCYEGTLNKYAGKLFCSRCGYRMGVAYNNKKRYYRCESAKYGKICCEGTTIFETTLDKAVISEANSLKAEYLDNEKVVKENSFYENDNKQSMRIKKQIADIESKIKENSFAVKNLYIDKLKGIITDDQFADLSEFFETEKKRLSAKSEALKNDLKEMDNHRLDERQKQRVISEMISFSEITRNFVDSFIKRIEVGGSKNNRIINIYWNF